jgi:pimeloyl-ACP methyl ester carboxylesterase
MTETAMTTSNRYQQDLYDFRESYPHRSSPIQTHNWESYDTGGAGFPLLLLHGGGGQAEAIFPQIRILSKHFRVIAPNIPPQIKTMEAVIDGLSTLLNALDIEKFTYSELVLIFLKGDRYDRV